MTPEMTKTNNAIGAAEQGGVADELNPVTMMQGISTELLVRAIAGEFDLLALARIELASRGRDEAGNWVGFLKAAEIHGV